MAQEPGVSNETLPLVPFRDKSLSGVGLVLRASAEFILLLSSFFSNHFLSAFLREI